MKVRVNWSARGVDVLGALLVVAVGFALVDVIGFLVLCVDRDPDALVVLSGLGFMGIAGGFCHWLLQDDFGDRS